MTIYRGIYVDVETNLANENIQVEKRIDILDTASDPFNFLLTSEAGTPGNTDYTLTFNTIPGLIFINVDYSSDGGLTWAFVSGSASPFEFTLPTADYIFNIFYRTDAGTFNYDIQGAVIHLEMTDSPVNDIVIDNAEDKFTPIRARQLAINIFSSNAISINTFSEGPDDRFKVNFYVDDVLNFTGFLSMGDLSQEFMPDPNVISLTAVDGLGFLNDIPLTDFNGHTPEYENTILDYLLWCLSKTGLQLNLKATFNIREVTASTIDADSTGVGHLFKYNYLDAKTFEAEIGECEDCYTVLTKILGEEAQLFQDWGVWRVLRIDEMDHSLPVATVYEWEWDGTFVAKTTETNEANVGEGESYSWMNDDALMSNERLVKESRLIFNFQTPKEVPCNIDFERGEESTTGTLTGYTLFDIDCWVTSRDFGSNETVPNTTAHIARAYDVNGYETDKFVVILMPSVAGNPPTYIKSQGIPVEAQDKFTFSMDYSAVEDNNDNDAFLLGIGLIVLYATDGTVYTLDCFTGNEPNWNLSDPEISIFRREIQWDLDPSVQDITEWLNFSITCNQIPKAGNIIIYLYAANRVASPADSFDIRYNNISFDYLPYTNGTYQKYDGQQTTVAQDIVTRNLREKEVFISDSPHRLFKGALLIISGYTEIYSDSAIFANGNSFTVPGYKVGVFRSKMRIVISDTTSNNITTQITLVEYSIALDLTTITVSGVTVGESDATVTIDLTLFGLAGLFYDAAKSPAAVADEKRFGEIQAFDVWNQVNRTMAKFEGTVDHSNPPPSLKTRWFLTDINPNTNNRMFLLLHYDYDSFLCEWQAFFFEVSNTDQAKQYTGNSFKYLTNE